MTSPEAHRRSGDPAIRRDLGLILLAVLGAAATCVRRLALPGAAPRTSPEAMDDIQAELQEMIVQARVEVPERAPEGDLPRARR
ncbi:MAG: hypothetical protein H0U12_08625 [Thermoleophilaceae bacterium]|nr:hypothetical protein [Thermoleophilaceae bacterium]